MNENAKHVESQRFIRLLNDNSWHSQGAAARRSGQTHKISMRLPWHVAYHSPQAGS